MFARLFYWESQQIKICKYINTISRENLHKEISLRDIPFNEKYLIGSATQKHQTNDNRYYHLYFLEYLPFGDSANSYIVSDKVKKGILEVDKHGQLTILDNEFNPMQTHTGFIFGTDIDCPGTDCLALVSKKAVEDYEKEKIFSRNINIVTGCIGAAALTLAAVKVLKK